MLEAMQEALLALVGSPWLFVALYAAVTIDGFFPPVPSESAVIALAALGVHSGQPDVWLMAVVAAAGACTGDLIAYALGARLPVRRMRIMRSARAQRAVSWAERSLTERGATFIIGSRFIPVGRVAVSMTAGSVGYSRARFALLAAIGAVTWSTYSTALGIGAGVWLDDQPAWVAMAVGIAAGLPLGVLVDVVLKRVLGALAGRSAAGLTAKPSR